MYSRELKAQQLVATNRITGRDGVYSVPSQSGTGSYRVILNGMFPGCTCPDFELTGKDCKHMIAARNWRAERSEKKRTERLDPAMVTGNR